jgi:hypothetical protein
MVVSICPLTCFVETTMGRAVKFKDQGSDNLRREYIIINKNKELLFAHVNCE